MKIFCRFFIYSSSIIRKSHQKGICDCHLWLDTGIRGGTIRQLFNKEVDVIS